MITILNFLTSIFSKFPSDPFVGYLQELDETLSQYIGYLNWVVPVGVIFAVTAGWATALITVRGLMYVYNILAKKVAS